MSGPEVMQFLKEKKLLETDLGYLTLSYEDEKAKIVSQINFAFHEDQTVLLVFEDAKENRWAIHGKDRPETVAIDDESVAKLTNFVDSDTAAKAVDHFVKTGERDSKLKWEKWEPIVEDDADPADFDEEEEEFTAKDKDFLQGLSFEEDDFDDDDW